MSNIKNQLNVKAGTPVHPKLTHKSKHLNREIDPTVYYKITKD
jgi:hypothetical protein